MEYRLLNILRNNFKIPFLARLFLCVLFIIIGSAPILLPLFPGSLFLGVFIFITGLIFIISPKKIRHLIKFRKSIIYMFSNIHRKKIVMHKIYDIKTHVMYILRDEKINN